MKKLLIAIICCCIFNNIKAQQNIVKFNALGLIASNLSFQYERSLNEKSSVCLGISFLPSRGLPTMVTSKDDENRAEDFTTSGFAITPEYRYYFTGNGPKGFYAAPYFRYANYTTGTFELTYDKEDGSTGTSDFSGDYTVTVGGVMVGAQWLLGEKWTLDWWIVGAAFGSQEGVYEATDNFSAQDQADIKEEFESIETDVIDMEIETSSTSAKLTINNSLPALRTGLCIGYRF